MVSLLSNTVKMSLAIFCMSALLTGCPDPQAEKANNAKKHLKIISIYAPVTFDPHIEPNWFMINSGTVETLVRVDQQLEIQPWLAQSWQTDDGIHWQINLRDGVKFHSGKPMTAESVRSSLLRSIEKNRAVKTALQIKSIEVKDNCLLIETETVHPTFISELVHPNTAILDVSADAIESRPMATGPYKVESVQSMVGAELVNNPDYWDGAAAIDRISFKGNTDANARLLALQSGDADIIYRPSAESLDTLKDVKNIVVDAIEGARVYYLLHNYQGPNAALMNNRAFRQGIDALIDRDAIVTSIMNRQGVAAEGPFLARFDFSPDYLPKGYDLEKALTYFAEAGLTVDNGKVSNNGKAITLNLAVYTARAEFPTIAQIFQDSAKKVGIEVKIQVVERIEEYLPQAQWDLATYALVTVPRGDASYFFNAACYPNRFLNFGQMNVAAINQKIDRLNLTIDKQQRNQLAKEIAAEIDRETYHANYIVYPKVTAAYSDRVSGWVTYPHELYLITKDIRID
jgi:peptide/nickel transport system substrate-binding protein